MTITDTKRRTEVFSFLNGASESAYDSTDYDAVKLTGPEIAEYLSTRDVPNPPELDIELLREQITWARKSFTVQEDFAQLGWQQDRWLETEFNGKKAEVRDEDSGELLGYVAEDFCNTAGCIAGSVAMRCGEPLWELMENGRYGSHRMKSGEFIEQFARDKLGLTTKEAHLMFSENCTIDFLETMAEGVCLRRGLEY